MKRFASILPGLVLLLACAVIVRQYAEPWIKLNWKSGFDLLHLNAMMLSFLLGIALGTCCRGRYGQLKGSQAQP